MYVKAIYMGGVLKPLQSLNIDEGEEVEISDATLFSTEKKKIDKTFEELEKIIPSLEDLVEENRTDKYMDKEYGFKKIGI